MSLDDRRTKRDLRIRRRLNWLKLYYQGDKSDSEWYMKRPLGHWDKNKPLGCSCWMCQGASFGQNRQKFYRMLDEYESKGWDGWPGKTFHDRIY